MERDKKRQSSFPFTSRSLIIPLLCFPLCYSIGMLINIIETFGQDLTVDNIKLNADMFAKQFASGIIFVGWSSVIVLSISALIAIIEVMWKWARIEDEKQDQKLKP